MISCAMMSWKRNYKNLKGKNSELEQEHKETADVYVGEMNRLKKYLEDGEMVRMV